MSQCSVLPLSLTKQRKRKRERKKKKDRTFCDISGLIVWFTLENDLQVEFMNFYIDLR